MSNTLTRTVTLRCYGRPVGADCHMAVCLTVNLVAQGRTQSEAIHRLHSLIKAYISDAVENDEFDEFVPRRAPLRFYLEYAACWTAHSLAKLMARRRPKICAFTDRHPIPAHA